MKAVIVYHKNVWNYPSQWLIDFVDSIKKQSDKDFDIFELNYGGGDERLFAKSIFESKEFENHAQAMNYLLGKAYSLNYQYFFNTNVDDVYDLDRIAVQMRYLGQGYDIVSSNFTLFDEQRGTFLIHDFDGLNIGAELAKDHNIICHPVVAYSRRFVQYERYIPAEIPKEDLKLWQRTVNNYKYIIAPEVLLHHREHENSVGRS